MEVTGPPNAPGTLYAWEVDAQGNQTHTDRGPSDRPAGEMLPWEICAAGVFTDGEGNRYTREARTTVRLHGNGGAWPKPVKSVVLNVQTLDKSDGRSLVWGPHDYVLQEPNGVWEGTEIDPASREVRVAGRVVDAQGQVLIQVSRNGSENVTPTVPNCPWYMYALSPVAPQTVRLTWSRHPQASTTSPQAKFDAGARLLAQDDDLRITNPIAPDDDVPVYVEFFIIPAQARIFPSDWATPEYNVITSEQRVKQLLGQTFANVKQVTFMGWEKNGQFQVFLGYSNIGAPSIVLMADAPAEVAMHEWGHTAGCEDRGDFPEAIMYRWYLGPGIHREVNKDEASLMKQWRSYWPLNQ